MKKLFVFSVLLCIFEIFSGTANAKCKLLSCGDTDLMNAWVQADIGGNQCWFCGPGPNSCGNNDVVPYLDGVGDIISLYQCSTGLIQKFVNYEPGRFCDDSDLISDKGVSGVDLSNAKKTFSFEGVKTKSYSLGDLEGFIGRASCVLVKCNPSYIPNDDKTKCVLDNRETICKSTGGSWSDGKCICSQSKNIKLIDGENKCECINSDYEPDGVYGCKKTDAAIAEEKRQQQNTINQQSKKECESSGGTWAASKCTCDQTKNLRLENNKCVCLNNTDYTYNAENKRCDLTNLAEKKMQCESEVSKESGAYWYNNDCMCQTQDYVWIDGMCKLNPKIDECRHINGAQWLNNECVCNDKNMEINEARTECVLTTDALLSINQSQAKEKISSAISELDEISSGLKLTVWRNEEGKFNTSRLLSDSIAGVVLGTAGGLITSNVVKKNQIENGFEDIQCSVGGQVVAGWGDEFRVGIQ